MSCPFTTTPVWCGPLRQPHQMLAEQVVDGHKSIHDDAMAAGLGLRAGPIKGPTHFSQFAAGQPHGPGRFSRPWVRTQVLDGNSGALVAEMVLNSATLKASYARYDEEARSLGRT